MTPLTASDQTGISLLDADPALAAAVPPEDLDAARSMLRVRRLTLTPGVWELPAGVDRALGLMVVGGLILREHIGEADGQVGLLGPGDIADVRPVAQGRERWRVVRRASVAVVDARLLLAGRRWPRLFVALTRRLFDMNQEQVTINGMLALPRVEERLLALLSHCAERWGRATPAGLVVDLPLTHLVLGRLVAARRPTVSLALGALVAEGRLSRDADGCWVLPLDADADGAAASASAGDSVLQLA